MANSGFTTADVYSFILEWAVLHGGNTPTQRQIAAACHVATGTAHHHRQVLIKQGLLNYADGAFWITKGQFVLDADAESLEPKVEESPILSMKIIPRKIQGVTRTRLKQLGIKIGVDFDEHHLHAVYPKGWRFEQLEAEEETFLLMDADEKYVGLYHENGGNPVFTYMMEE